MFVALGLSRSITRMHGCMELMPFGRTLLLYLAMGCYRTCPHIAAIVAAPTSPASPATMIRMCLLPRLLRYSRMRGPLCPRGPPLPTPTSRACSWNTCNMKHLLQHTSETNETFRTYYCNIYVWTLQHMQHSDKTLATYI
jgi:hypothetical protein